MTIGGVKSYRIGVRIAVTRSSTWNEIAIISRVLRVYRPRC